MAPETRKLELATLYELRLTISYSAKEQYTKEELLRLIDEFAVGKNERAAR